MSCFVRLLLWDDEAEEEAQASWRYLNIDTITLIQETRYTDTDELEEGYSWMRVQYNSTDNAILCTKLRPDGVYKAIKKAQRAMGRRVGLL